MTNILLISEDTLKTYSNLNENIYGKSIAPSIVISQDIYLQKFLGSCLYKKILELVDNCMIESIINQHYKYLLDEYITPFLIYQTIANLIPELSVKVANLGTLISNDEHLENLSQGDRNLVIAHYQNIADSYCRYMQVYLKENRMKFPELNCECDSPVLDSSSDTGLFLGGERGRIIL